MSDDVMNARAIAADLPGFPPALYLSLDVGDSGTDVLPALAHLGLPPVTLVVDGERADMDLFQAQGKQWLLAIGPRRQVEVRCPAAEGGDLALLSGVTITDPDGWCDEVLEQGHVLVFVGPPLPWKRGQMGLSRVLALLGTRAVCAGVIPAELVDPVGDLA